MPSQAETFTFFKDSLLSAFRQKLLSVDQVKSITDFAEGSLFAHFRLYQLVLGVGRDPAPTWIRIYSKAGELEIDSFAPRHLPEIMEGTVPWAEKEFPEPPVVPVAEEEADEEEKGEEEKMEENDPKEEAEETVVVQVSEPVRVTVTDRTPGRQFGNLRSFRKIVIEEEKPESVIEERVVLNLNFFGAL